MHDCALRDCHLLVTRPEHQATALCDLLLKLGAKVSRFPLLETRALDWSSESGGGLSLDTRYGWVLFTSANAVRYAFDDEEFRRFVTSTAARIGAIGAATARSLADRGIEVQLQPACDFSSRGLLAEISVDASHVLIVGGRGGRRELDDGLREAGATVARLEVYERRATDADLRLFLHGLNDPLDLIITTSGEALEQLLDRMGERFQEHLRRGAIALIVSHPRHVARCRELGFAGVIQAPVRMSDSDLVAAAGAALAERAARKR